MVRRGLVHADNIFAEESHGDHGPSAEADKRPQLARELEDRAHRPRPHRHAARLGLARGRRRQPRGARAPRRAAAPRVRHRAQAAAPARTCSSSCSSPTCPASCSPSRYYDSMLLPEEFGAMVPTATTHVGTKAGPAIAKTLSAAELPVLFDLTEACRSARPPSVLCAGTPGLGQDDAAAVPDVPGRPAGLAGLRHRPQGRPPLDRAARRSPTASR